jgi:DMSO/TMAO reductase YedYZ molybdopterin-dependent catalytic subunit
MPVSAMPGGDAFAGGRLLGSVEFHDEGVAPVGSPIASELDERLYTDLSRVSEHNLLTSTAEFYVRTGASRLLPHPSRWTISLDGLVEQPAELHIDALRRAAKPMGLHLMECAGNVRITHFGLISVADWEGVSLADVLSHLKIKPGASRVCISGFDQYAGQSLTSMPGASWIFPIEELKAARAFLATGMNGRLLTPDHGAPVRLFVPGWYGCACIKWVNHITLIDEEAEATTQMQEYAARTLQDDIHRLAKDYRPALIDHAAMPVRVEKWTVAGKLKYRVTGILWGGSQLVKTLHIRFNPNQDFVPISGLRQSRNDPWTIWTHTWSPREPGTYTIRMAITDPPVQARKLDAGYYDRFVEIDEI